MDRMHMTIRLTPRNSAKSAQMDRKYRRVLPAPLPPPVNVALDVGEGGSKKRRRSAHHVACDPCRAKKISAGWLSLVLRAALTPWHIRHSATGKDRPARRAL